MKNLLATIALALALCAAASPARASNTFCVVGEVTAVADVYQGPRGQTLDLVGCRVMLVDRQNDVPFDVRLMFESGITKDDCAAAEVGATVKISGFVGPSYCEGDFCVHEPTHYGLAVAAVKPSRSCGGKSVG